jgi:hypothetical protein
MSGRERSEVAGASPTLRGRMSGALLASCGPALLMGAVLAGGRKNLGLFLGRVAASFRSAIVDSILGGERSGAAGTSTEVFTGLAGAGITKDFRSLGNAGVQTINVGRARSRGKWISGGTSGCTSVCFTGSTRRVGGTKGRYSFGCEFAGAESGADSAAAAAWDSAGAPYRGDAVLDLPGDACFSAFSSGLRGRRKSSGRMRSTEYRFSSERF